MLYSNQIPRYPSDTDCIEIDYASVKSFPIHWHSYYEFELVTQGDGVQTINGIEYSYKTGDAFLLGPTDFHKRNLDNPADIWIIKIPIWLIPSSFYDVVFQTNLPAVAHLNNKELIFSIELLKLLEKHSEISTTTDSIMTTLFVYVFSLDKRETNNNYTDRIAMIYRYLQENFSGNISLKDISLKFNLSEKYLCSYFKKHTGRTIIDTLREMRMYYASHMILVTNEPISEMYLRCGYNSSTYFVSDFKKKFGMTPTDMRKKRGARH